MGNFWGYISKNSGSGDDTIAISADAYTGRIARTYGNGTSSGIKVSCGSDSTAKYIKVSLNAKPEFISLSEYTKTIPEDASTVFITGLTNSQKITYSYKTGTLFIVLPENYIAANSDCSNGTVIPGDPGSSSLFNFEIQLNIPQNTAYQREETIKILINNSNTVEYSLILKGIPYLILDLGKLNIHCLK